MSDFIEDAVGDSESGLRITVGWLDHEVDTGAVIGLLADAGVKHGITSPDDIRQAAIANNVPETSAMAVAYADIARFGFIYRRKGK